MMGRRFDTNEARGKLVMERRHIPAFLLTAKDHTTARTPGMKNSLRDIETEGYSSWIWLVRIIGG